MFGIMPGQETSEERFTETATKIYAPEIADQPTVTIKGHSQGLTEEVD